MQLQESGEMYLETIFVLTRNSDTVRAIDVGEYMGYSKPSVSRALSLLKEGGFILTSKEGYISFTPLGLEFAEKIYERHKILTEVLLKIGVDAKIAASDACKIEHVISDETLSAIKKYIDK